MNFSARSAVSALIVVAMSSGGAQAAQSAAQPAVAKATSTRAHVEKLASPALEGRLTGSNGERLASDYLADELRKMGAKPLPGQADYRVAFDFTAGTRDGGTSVRRRRPDVYRARRGAGALLFRQRRRHR